MGKIKIFRFELLNNKTVFYPGQWVAGSCKLVLNENLKIKSFQIRCIGETCFRQKKGGPIRRREVVTPIQIQNIYGSSTLSSGQHSNDFRFQIPAETLPTSFEGDFGYIRYYLEGVIDRSWKDTVTTRKVFTVWEYIDCNNPLLSAPQIGQSEKLVPGGCFTAPRRNTIVLQLDRKGYCPGEHVIVSVQAEDFPLGIIFKLMLTMVSVFAEGAGKSALSKREVLKTVDVGCMPPRKNSHRFNNVSLIIPSVPPTIRWRGASGLGISVYYMVELKMFKRVDNKKQKLYWHVNLPVTMGTIPLNPNNANQSRPALQATLSTGNTAAEPPAYADIVPSAPPPLQISEHESPPSYEECILGGSNVRDESGEQGVRQSIYGDSLYTPVYTMVRGSRLDYRFAQ